MTYLKERASKKLDFKCKKLLVLKFNFIDGGNRSKAHVFLICPVHLSGKCALINYIQTVESFTPWLTQMQQLSTCKFGPLENDERWKGYLKMLTADLLQAWMIKMPLLRVLQQNKLIIAENVSSRHSPLQQLPGADESKPASHKQIWSMSIFPRHLVLSLVIWLKIIHQLVQICFLIGPQCTCYV